MIKKLKKNHAEVNDENLKIIQKKQLLKLIYLDYFKVIKKNLSTFNNPNILEIGSGPGIIKQVINNCITSENFENPYLDRKENIYDLNFNNESLTDIVMVDVFHHLKYPMLGLSEMNRVLKKNGKVIMIEPAMGMIPKFIYAIFHKEPNGFNMRISLSENKEPDLHKFFAAQSYPYRIFYKKEIKIDKFFNISKVELKSDFSFLGSGGFGYTQFYPKVLYNLIKKFDNILSILPLLFAARMIITLEKVN